MSGKLTLKSQFFGYDDKDDSWLGSVYIEHSEGVAGITKEKRMLTEAVRLLREKDYEIVTAPECVPDNNNERTLVINEEYMAVIVKFKEFDLDETMFETDVMQVARAVEPG